MEPTTSCPKGVYNVACLAYCCTVFFWHVSKIVCGEVASSQQALIGIPHLRLLGTLGILQVKIRKPGDEATKDQIMNNNIIRLEVLIRRVP